MVMLTKIILVKFLDGDQSRIHPQRTGVHDWPALNKPDPSFKSTNLKYKFNLVFKVQI